MWMIRAGRGGENLDDFLQKGVVGFGGPKLGKLSPTTTKDDLLKLYATHYPEDKEGSRASWASQLTRFLGEVKVGDPVVTFDRDRRLYILGKVTGEYLWKPDLVTGKPHLREVEWLQQSPRDALSATTRNTLGSVLAIFKVGPEAARELVEQAGPLGTPPLPSSRRRRWARTPRNWGCSRPRRSSGPTSSSRTRSTRSTGSRCKSWWSASCAPWATASRCPSLDLTGGSTYSPPHDFSRASVPLG